MARRGGSWNCDLISSGDGFNFPADISLIDCVFIKKNQSLTSRPS